MTTITSLLKAYPIYLALLLYQVLYITHLDIFQRGLNQEFTAAEPYECPGDHAGDG